MALGSGPNSSSGRASGVTNVKCTSSMPAPHTWRAVMMASSYSGRLHARLLGTTKATRCAYPSWRSASSPARASGAPSAPNVMACRWTGMLRAPTATSRESKESVAPSLVVTERRTGSTFSSVPHTSSAPKSLTISASGWWAAWPRQKGSATSRGR